MDARPLAGLKVMDLAWVVAGPIIGRVLADFGATVVRIESSKRVETARLMGPFPDGRTDKQRSVLYDNCNANKLGLALDLTQEDGRAVARDLATWADVVVESFMPGQMARFGLDFERLRARNPSLIMVSTSLMGQTGPYSKMSGYGNIGAAMSGFQMMVGESGQMPVGPFGPYTDYVGPRFALVTLLAALDHRRRTGEGCLIDVSQAESGISLLAPQIAEYCATGRVATACGNRDAAFAPHGVFRAVEPDVWVAIVARDDAEWRKVAELIGGTALATDPRFTTLADRKQNEDALDGIVAGWTSKVAAAEVEQRLQALDVPCAVVADSACFVQDPQLIAAGHFVRLPHPLGGDSLFEAARYDLLDTPAQYERCAPTFGRDNDRVLRDFLNYDDARIQGLAQAGVLA